MMTKVYVVATEYYDDYTVEAVCSSRENAEYFLSIGIGNTIDMFYLDGGIHLIKQGYRYYLIIVKRSALFGNINTGKVVDITLNGFIPDILDINSVIVDYKRPGKGNKISHVLWVYCWAKNKKEAKKIAKGEFDKLVVSNRDL